MSQAGTLTISDHGFNAFTQLIQLNISRSRIFALNSNWFSQNNVIRSLDVSWNKLTSLKRDNLRSLTKLVVANFSNNEIDEVARSSFSDSRLIKILDLGKNRLASVFDLNDLSGLEVLNLDHNSLVEVSIYFSVNHYINYD